MAETMSTRIVSFLSAKGGSGKTVTSSALGTLLAALGFKVLLVDTDAATNGMTLLFLEQLLDVRQKSSSTTTKQLGLFEVAPDVAPTMIEVADNLWLAPATFRMTETESVDIGTFSQSLRCLLDATREYDFVLLDAQAGSDGYARAAASAAETDVIVSEYDPVSAQGIERLKVFFANEMPSGSTWTLFNKVLPEFASVIGEGLSVAKFLPPVPWDADVVRAFARRDLAINMALPNPYTLAIAQLAYSLFPDKAGDAIEKWRGGALSSVVSPVEQRLLELKTVEDKLFDIERKRIRITSISAGTIGLLAIGGIAFLTLGFEPKDQDVPISLLANVAALLGVVLSVSFGFKWIGKLFNVNKDQSTLSSIAVEREKLVTTLEAARSTFRVDEKAGIFERRRRSSSQQGPRTES